MKLAFKTHKGQFIPKNLDKYIGNPNNIRFLSGWEHRLMKELDRNPKVTRWNSEDVHITYFHPFKKRPAKYMMDFMVEWRGIETFLIEVKPYAQTIPPPKQKRNTKRYLNEQATYGVNIAKWQQAEKYCSKRKIKFIIIHEFNVSDYFPGVKFLSRTKKKIKKKV